MNRKGHDVGERQQAPLGAQASDAALAAAVNCRLSGANDVEQNDRYYTPLHFAAQYGLTNFAKSLLLDPEANVKALTRDLRSPLYVAAENRQADIVSLLIDNGADVNSFHGRNDTPLHCAIRAGDEEITQALLDAGAKVSWPGKSPANAVECVKEASLTGALWLENLSGC